MDCAKVLLALVLAGGAVEGCGKNEAEKPAAGPAAPAVPTPTPPPVPEVPKLPSSEAIREKLDAVSNSIQAATQKVGTEVGNAIHKATTRATGTQ